MKNVALIFITAFSVCIAMPVFAAHHKVADIVIDAPYVRAPVSGQAMTAGFFKASNNTDKNCVLTGVSSNYAKKIEFHAHQHIDGMMRMRPVSQVELPAGSDLHFKPGGLHLMFFGLSSSDQLSVDLSLITDNCGEISFKAPIRSIKSMLMDSVRR